MPAAIRPAPDDAEAARRIVLTGLGRDAALPDLLGEIEPLHPRNNTFPGEVFLRLAAGALAWAGASRADPLSLEGMRERFLPELSRRSRDRRKLQYPVLAAPAVHCGTEPDRSTRSPGGRPTTSGSTRSSPRSCTSVPPPAVQACRWRRPARNWPAGSAMSLADPGFTTPLLSCCQACCASRPMTSWRRMR
jgi:hypothetical protein